MNTTDLKPLPARPRLEQYKKQAKELVKASKSGNSEAIERIQKYHPRAGKLVESGRLRGKFVLADAQLVIAREHGFESWPKFGKHLDGLAQKDSRVLQFESAADAIVTGDVATLERLLRENPELIRARSTRVHQAMLLHYVGANGFENYRQKTPKNAVEVTKILLKAGAEVDAMADTYGKGTTLGLVATSYHPARAGVQIALMETLLDAGASVDGLPGGWNPLVSALHNGRPEAAEFLAERGARLDLEGAAGVGRLDVVKGFFNEDGSLKGNATKQQMEAGFMWACEYGRTGVVEFLLQMGMEVGAHPHGETGLHWAAYGGHLETVRLLLERKAPVDLKDKHHDGTPLGWALYGWGNPPPEAKNTRYYEVVALLVSAGATVEPEWLKNDEDRRAVGAKVRRDPRMLAALGGETFGNLRG